MARHVIGSQIMETSFDEESKSIALQNKISSIARGALRLKIDEAIDSLFGECDHYRFDRIVIDLGALTYSEIEDELAERACRKLKEALADAKRRAEESGESGPDQMVRPAESYLELLERFLVSGYLPWWAHRQEISLEDSVYRLIGDDPRGLASLLKRIGRNEAVRARLVSRFSESALRDVIRVLQPQDADFILGFVDEVKDLNRKQEATSLEGKEFARSVWRVVYDYVLADSGTVFNRQSFLRFSIKKLASRTSSDYLAILSAMGAAIRSLGPEGASGGSEIRNAILELEDEERANRQLAENAAFGFDPIYVLRIYLRSGALPWRCPLPAGSDWSELASSALDAAPGLFWSLATEFAANRYALERLAGVASDSQREALLAKRTKGIGDFTVAWVRLIESTLAGERAEGRSLWAAVLIVLAGRTALEFTPGVFARSLLVKACDLMGLDEAALLLLMRKVEKMGEWERSLINTMIEERRIRIENEGSRLPDEDCADRFVELSDALSEGADGKTSLKINDALKSLAEKAPDRLVKWLAGEDLARVVEVANLGNLERLIQLANRRLALKAIRLAGSIHRRLIAGSFGAASRLEFRSVLLSIVLRLFLESPNRAWDELGLTRAMLLKAAERASIPMGDLVKRLMVRTAWDDASSPLGLLDREYQARKRAEDDDTSESERWPSLEEAVRSRLLDGYLPYWAAPYAERSLKELLLEWIALNPARALAAMREWADRGGVLERLAGELDLERILEFLAEGEAGKASHLAAVSRALSALQVSDERRRSLLGAFRGIALYELLSERSGNFDTVEFLRSALERLAVECSVDVEALRLCLMDSTTDSDLKTAAESIGEIARSPSGEYAKIERTLKGSGYFDGASGWLLAGGHYQELNECLGLLMEKSMWSEGDSEIAISGNLSALIHLVAKRRRLSLEAAMRLFLEGRGIPERLKTRIASELGEAPAEKCEKQDPKSALLEQATQGVIAQAASRWQLDDAPGHLIDQVLRETVLLGCWSEGAGMAAIRGNFARLVTRLSEISGQPLNALLGQILKQDELDTWVREESTWLRGKSETELAEFLESSKPKPKAEPEKKPHPKLERSKRPEPEERVEPITEPIYVTNAGLTLLHPYLKLYFERLKLMEGSGFLNTDAKVRSVGLLQYLVTGLSAWEEHHLVLNKLLCGLPVDYPVDTEYAFTDGEKELSDGLLRAFVGHWPALKSIDGLRGDWLIRDGQLREKDERFELIVERKPYDLLLAKCPVSLSLVNFKWMAKPLGVQWT